jgi:membrane associated rhomboid family serine protease
MECPSCGSRLAPQKSVHGLIWACPQCRGRAVTLPVLRKAGAETAFLADVWRQGRAKAAKRSRACPLCGRLMAQVETAIASQPLNLDVCPTCPAVWFDPSEYPSVPTQPAPARIEEHMSPEARERFAILQVRDMARRRQEEEAGPFGAPDEAWHWLPGLLGLPIELDAPAVTRRPWLTWGLTVGCILATVSILSVPTTQANSILWKWGFIPAQWDRFACLTLITSFFLHGGFFHLLGNMYFLFVFGDNVEERLGHGVYLLILLAAHITGLASQAVFAPNPEMPCVGASAGISGVIALYAVLFPNVRLAFLFRYFVYFQWFRIRAVWALVLFILLQVIGASLQVRGFGGVAYLAHAGGLMVGIGVGLAYRYRPKPTAGLAST